MLRLPLGYSVKPARLVRNPSTRLMKPQPTFQSHWPEYVLDGACLGLFMVSAAVFATFMQHPDLPFARWRDAHAIAPLFARVPMAVAMGCTAIALIYSPIGQRSGAHMNPAVTLTYTWLGRVPARDALGYVAAQLIGGLAGLAVAVWLLRGLPGDPSVNYVATLPGKWGVWPAFAGEVLMSFTLMATVLTVSSKPETARFTGVAAGCLVALFIAFEAPVSGMSMNVARTLPSNLFARQLSTLWIYAVAPLLGMLGAAAWFVRQQGAARVGCAKLHHASTVRCIFCGQGLSS